MIVSHILGGIGNQMFQYAAGRSLAIHLNDYYMLDLNDFDRYALHNGYELKQHFSLPVGIVLFLCTCIFMVYNKIRLWRF